MTNNLQSQLEKSAFGQTLDIDYHMERLTSFPEGDWFMPNNVEHPDFQICVLLCELNLIQKKNEPQWSNGSFRGHKIYFRYKLNLNY